MIVNPRSVKVLEHELDECVTLLKQQRVVSPFEVADNQYATRIEDVENGKKVIIYRQSKMSGELLAWDLTFDNTHIHLIIPSLCYRKSSSRLVVESVKDIKDFIVKSTIEAFTDYPSTTGLTYKKDKDHSDVISKEGHVNLIKYLNSEFEGVKAKKYMKSGIVIKLKKTKKVIFIEPTYGEIYHPFLVSIHKLNMLGLAGDLLEKKKVRQTLGASVGSVMHYIMSENQLSSLYP